MRQAYHLHDDGGHGHGCTENGVGRLVIPKSPGSRTAFAGGVAHILERRSLGLRTDADEDTLRRDKPLLAELYGASSLAWKIYFLSLSKRW